jgi:peptidoglycan hydrolase CwlO-like protein
MASDFASIRSQLEGLAAKQEQMVATGAMPQEQLKAMISDFAGVRRQLEQVAAKQGQIAEDITNLQATEGNLSQKIAALSQSHAARTRRHRKTP